MLRQSPYEKRVALRQGAVLLTCLSMTAYFAFHAIHGRHGFKARTDLMERSQLLDFEIRSLEAVRSHLAHDVALLTPQIPDADIVEDVARDMLGFVRPGDVFVGANARP